MSPNQSASPMEAGPSDTTLQDAAPPSPSRAQNLPHEITHEIFVLFRETFQPYTDTGLTHASLILSHVCRRWRYVSLFYPRLWNELSLKDEESTVAVLARGGNDTPLDVDFRCKRKPSSTRLNAILRFVEELSRVRKLHITSINEVLNFWYNTLNQCSAPMLEDFSVISLGEQELFVFQANFLGGPFSHLKKLRLENCDLDWRAPIFTDVMTELTLVDVPFPTSYMGVRRMVSAFENMPNLINLSISFLPRSTIITDHNEDFPEVPTLENMQWPISTLSKLQRLDLVGMVTHCGRFLSLNRPGPNTTVNLTLEYNARKEDWSEACDDLFDGLDTFLEDVIFDALNIGKIARWQWSFYAGQSNHNQNQWPFTPITRDPSHSSLAGGYGTPTNRIPIDRQRFNLSISFGSRGSPPTHEHVLSFLCHVLCQLRVGDTLRTLHLASKAKLNEDWLTRPLGRMPQLENFSLEFIEPMKALLILFGLPCQSLEEYDHCLSTDHVCSQDLYMHKLKRLEVYEPDAGASQTSSERHDVWQDFLRGMRLRKSNRHRWMCVLLRECDLEEKIVCDLQGTVQQVTQAFSPPVSD
ncbi:hypothetical protein EW146_g6825 [Bondarzewia mesenterica]|uniref:Uncharacterized protein n=1 Tax=Bondarzewia mesenterica TaxID=1095465 RepID=A0A4S4LMF1_9AGAM|nr:hypothetical protein EW146_g6825 [Bondarzewia mesenterica]